MSEVTARRVGPHDWRIWRELRLGALAESPEIFPTELARAQGYDEPAWRQRLDPDSGVWIVADAEDRAVGQVGAWLPFGSVPTMVALWVRPDWRGRGVGDALVGDVLDWAGESGYRRVDLWVLESNEPARQLYRRHGFVAQDDYLPYPDAPKLREQLMTWRA
jgi:GNAT superfamily N-acetyltransferase